jgi:hypothetical protein
MSNKLNVGDRVILPTGSHSPSPDYPYQGSKFACGGTITATYEGKFSREPMATIMWDNGRIAGAYMDNLKFESEGMKQTDPNIMFKLGKRTRHE